MRTRRTGAVLALAATMLAGCSGFGADKPAPAIDPNAFPANYRKDVANFLPVNLMDRAEFRGALIAAPALKPVGDAQRYVVCLQFNGYNQRKDKVAIYFGGELQQFIDPTPEQCAGAAYQPFTELASEIPAR